MKIYYNEYILFSFYHFPMSAIFIIIFRSTEQQCIVKQPPSITKSHCSSATIKTHLLYAHLLFILSTLYYVYIDTQHNKLRCSAILSRRKLEIARRKWEKMHQARGICTTTTTTKQGQSGRQIWAEKKLVLTKQRREITVGKGCGSWFYMAALVVGFFYGSQGECFCQAHTSPIVSHRRLDMSKFVEIVWLSCQVINIGARAVQ